MGASRSYTRLREALKLTKHGDITTRTLSNWSTEEHWQARLAAWDKTQERDGPRRLTAADATDPEFDVFSLS
jgi:hypothetical protein